MNGNAAANKIFKLLDTEEQKDGSVELSNIDNITFSVWWFGLKLDMGRKLLIVCLFNN